MPPVSDKKIYPLPQPGKREFELQAEVVPNKFFKPGDGSTPTQLQLDLIDVTLDGKRHRCWQKVRPAQYKPTDKVPMLLTLVEGKPVTDIDNEKLPARLNGKKVTLTIFHRAKQGGANAGEMTWDIQELVRMNFNGPAAPAATPDAVVSPEEAVAMRTALRVLYSEEEIRPKTAKLMAALGFGEKKTSDLTESEADKFWAALAVKASDNDVAITVYARPEPF